jgi:hypothetical protein
MGIRNFVESSVVDPVGSASFGWIGIGIQGLPIQIRICIQCNLNQMQRKTKFQKNFDIYFTDDKEKKMFTAIAANKVKKFQFSNM